MISERESSRPPAAESPAVRRRGPNGGSSLADVLDRVLDKGIVIDAWVRVSVVGLELLTVEARVVIASVETYLKYAEAIRNIELASKPASESSPMKYTETPYLESRPKRLAEDLPEMIAESFESTPSKLRRVASHLPKKLADAPKKLAGAVREAVGREEVREEARTPKRRPVATAEEEALVELTDDDVAEYLSENERGLALQDLEDHFHASRKQIQSVLRHLVDARRVRWDEDREIVTPRAR